MKQKPITLDDICEMVAGVTAELRGHFVGNVLLSVDQERVTCKTDATYDAAGLGELFGTACRHMLASLPESVREQLYPRLVACFVYHLHAGAEIEKQEGKAVSYVHVPTRKQ